MLPPAPDTFAGRRLARDLKKYVRDCETEVAALASGIQSGASRCRLLTHRIKRYDSEPVTPEDGIWESLAHPGFNTSRRHFDRSRLHESNDLTLGELIRLVESEVIEEVELLQPLVQRFLDHRKFTSNPDESLVTTREFRIRHLRKDIESRLFREYFFSVRSLGHGVFEIDHPSRGFVRPILEPHEFCAVALEGLEAATSEVQRTHRILRTFNVLFCASILVGWLNWSVLQRNPELFLYLGAIAFSLFGARASRSGAKVVSWVLFSIALLGYLLATGHQGGLYSPMEKLLGTGVIWVLYEIGEYFLRSPRGRQAK